jgi:arylsulfatase A-like enzyme
MDNMRQSRRNFVKAMGLGAAAFSLGSLPQKALSGGRSDRPNIIFIMADDCSRDWLGCYGSQENATPNLDKLATGGIRFETFWVTPICTPTRNMLLTGRYPFRTGWVRHHDAPRWGGQYFDWNREITFARVLKEAGYATAIGGKWQVNDLRTHPDALERHGFDEHCLWSGFETGNPPSAERYWDPYIITNGKRKVHHEAFGPDIVNDFLRDFVRRHRDGPFMVYYPMILTHGPFTPTPHNRDKLQDKSDKKELYRSMVHYADFLIGRLVRTLDELGIRDNTVIFYTGDNGSSCGGKAWGQEQLNKAKGNKSDKGAHTPLVVNWPGGIKPGRATSDLSDISDMMPTFAELAGATLPEGVKIDGESIVSILKGADGPRRKWIFSQIEDKRFIRDKRFILHVDGRMYDLAADPYEKNNLAASTDPDVASARQKLQKVLDSFGENKKYEGFPPRYSESNKVPDLPAGSGRWKDYRTNDKKTKRTRPAR